MATLVRTRPDSDLLASIPAPFPVHLLDDDDLDQLAVEPVDYGPEHTVLDAVQHSCLATLAHILSLPPSATDIPLEQALSESPLASLVHGLTERDGHPDHLTDAALLAQLRDRVDALVPSLDTHDARLAQAIVALLFDLEQLSSSSLARPPARDTDTSVSASIASLRRRLSSFQPFSLASASTSQSALWARIDQQLNTILFLCRTRASSPPQLHASQAPHSSESRSDLRMSFDTLPPDYDAEFYSYPEDPPSYVPLHVSPEDAPGEKRLADQYPPEKVSLHASASVCPASTELTTTDPATSSNSLDLDAVTRAIVRLYAVAPQLTNQRVELRREKIAQMERAKAGKGKARKIADPVDPEFDKLLDLLGKASTREIPDQSVVVNPRRAAREKGAADIEEQRNKYLEHLLHRTYVGRLHTQDAIPSSSSTGDRVHDTEDHEAQPESRGSRDSKRASYPNAPTSSSALEPPSEKLRNRSLSAPHLAWLKPKDKSGNATSVKESINSMTRSLSSDPRISLPSSTPRSVRSLSKRLRSGSKSRSPSISREDVSYGALDIAYVAEHHETLKHVLLFIAYATSSSSASNGVPSAEVLPSTSSGTYGDSLFLRLAGTPSPPLALPVPVVPGSKTVLNRSGHWEIKASCYQSGVPLKESEDVGLLPASELALLSPSSYTCSSCSLPLVPAPPVRYRDLPSEHWEEFIEAWICHPEGQTLVHTNNGDGKASNLEFWPTRDETLVGGSYVLFDAEAVAGGNIKCIGGRECSSNARLTRCLCGAIVGRQHDRKQKDGSVSRMYRLFKYAIRPISAASQVPKIPISAFVLHDMLEHVQAHATYRFVLLDDEDEKPRLLIWLFKPRLRISYMLPRPALLPKSGTVDASKALYKVLGPMSATSDFKEILNKYPGFPQAEYLFYPMDVCRKLAALLKESTASYPESMRTMTGLDVGWLTTI